MTDTEKLVMFNQIVSYIDGYIFQSSELYNGLIDTKKEEDSIRFYFDKEFTLKKLQDIIKELKDNVIFFNHYFIDGNFNNGLILIIPFIENDKSYKLVYL